MHCLESHYPFVNRSTGAAAVLALTRAGFCLVRIPPLRMAVASNYRLHCIQCCANWLIKHMVVAVFQAAPPFFVLPGFPRSMRNFIRLRPTSRSFFVDTSVERLCMVCCMLIAGRARFFRPGHVLSRCQEPPTEQLQGSVVGCALKSDWYN